MVDRIGYCTEKQIESEKNTNQISFIIHGSSTAWEDKQLLNFSLIYLTWEIRSTCKTIKVSTVLSFYKLIGYTDKVRSNFKREINKIK